MPDALGTLSRLRKLETNQARRAFADAVIQENNARTFAESAHAARRREATLATSDAADPRAGAFAAWLPASAQTIASAKSAVHHHGEATEAARAVLARHKASLEAVHLLVAERDAVRMRKLARRTQSSLDELGHRLG